MLEQLLGTHIHMITISERPDVDEEENEKINRDAFDATLYSLERSMTDGQSYRFQKQKNRNTGK